MIFEPGAAPILEQGDKVTAKFPSGDVDGVIVGCATSDMEINPMYIVYCTDGTFPIPAYQYTPFVYPLSQLELR